ncbi:hypothetical protein GYMLUDRAFT_392993 [Collybiopsis luxurians FD-317 M1]|uniref:Unplaced genomic scaffold GYMLUscaffold_112, whole genome shotgun sequence n=1 Tax=Collybiopsis luxurians FD-317 M1 TaxID=944289 RepID=A0A0D0C1H4_9AGAR|nr:hypothetical protein GYMLUDRAFT_392993 [Collybiopsis luxurians FD-317 M1]
MRPRRIPTTLSYSTRDLTLLPQCSHRLGIYRLRPFPSSSTLIFRASSQYDPLHCASLREDPRCRKG